MRIVLKKAEIDSFKDISHMECEFGEKITDIRGANGLGKTTIANAILFTLFDCDYQLNNKPTVQPIGNTEVKPHVKLWLDIDGKEITAEKTQKTSVKYDENSGKTTATTTNTYAVNDVPKTLRDFTAYFNEMNIDLDKLLVSVHPDAFTKDSSAKGRERMREVLFEMASEKTDLEIANEMNSVPELKNKLEAGYKLEEVKAMNQATIKKILTENGKNNELIDAKIAGMLESKVTVDEKELEYKETAAKAVIAQLEENIKELENPNNNTEVRIAELEASIKALELKAKEDYYLKRNEHLKAHSELVEKFREIESIINKANKSLGEANAIVDRDNKLILELRAKYDAEFAKKFEMDGKCPHCGQDLPQEMLQRAEHIFNDEKAKKLNDIKAQGDAIGKELERQAAEIADAKEQIEKYTPQYESLKAQIETSAKWNLTEPQASDIPEIVSLQAEISELKSQTDNSYIDDLNRNNEALGKVRAELSEIEGTRQVLENNKNIDSKVAELRSKKMTDEGIKANAEKLLYQIEQLERSKNEMMTAEINKHFSLVEWKLFDYAKNGEYKAVCIPTYQGKEINTQTNAALTIQLKVDIAESLQKFYGTYAPVIIDEAERLDSTTRSLIGCESQLIYMTVSDDLEINIRRN